MENKFYIIAVNDPNLELILSLCGAERQDQRTSLDGSLFILNPIKEHEVLLLYIVVKNPRQLMFTKEWQGDDYGYKELITIEKPIK